jgi:hypothetical protein
VILSDGKIEVPGYVILKSRTNAAAVLQEAPGYFGTSPQPGPLFPVATGARTTHNRRIPFQTVSAAVYLRFFLLPYTPTHSSTRNLLHLYLSILFARA